MVEVEKKLGENWERDAEKTVWANKKDLDFTSKSLFFLEPGIRIELTTY